MAIYHMSVKTGGRGKGQSAVASASYRSAEMLVDERTGEVFDYRRKEGVVASGILAPDDAPEWTRDRARLWNKVEASERRKDARTFREFEVALPAELTTEQQKDLVRSWVKAELVSRGMIADICIHDTGKGNPHAHIMCTTRDLAPDGESFAGKNRDWDKKDLLKSWRKSWAMSCNHALARQGHTADVDHRSHRARGIDREPQIHHGGRSGLMAKNDAVIARNAERDALDREEAAIMAGAKSRQETDKTMHDIAGLMVRAAAAKRQRDAAKAVEEQERQRQAEEAAALELLAKRARQDAEALADQADAYLAERDRQVEQARRRAEAARQKAEEVAREEARRRAQAPKPQIPVIADGQTLEGRIEESTRAGWWVIGGHHVPAGGQHQVGDMVRVKRVGDRLDVVDLNPNRTKAQAGKSNQGPIRGPSGHGRGM